MKFKLIFGLLILFIAGCNSSVFTMESSQLTSENFVKNSETYKFDGIPESFKYTGFEQLNCSYCWNFRFEFDSSQAGYGNRKDLMLAQVITHHVILVNIENGKVTSAIVDNKWDEINQKEL